MKYNIKILSIILLFFQLKTVTAQIELIPNVIESNFQLEQIWDLQISNSLTDTNVNIVAQIKNQQGEILFTATTQNFLLSSGLQFLNIGQIYPITYTYGTSPEALNTAKC